MDEKLKKKLISQIQRLCEKQYRKGFQQGFYASEEKQMTKNQVDQFRQKGVLQDYKKLVWPQTKHDEIAKDRLLAEMEMKDMDELQLLFD
jgi:hypothetical protein